MNIAELFVSLGVKGSEKTVGALKGVKSGLGEVSSMSLEAKAGILGAMYALERMFAISGQTGTSLTNFNALLGMSTKELQQWQYAGRQVGISNEMMASSFKSINSVMANMAMGKGAPEGFAQVANKVGLDGNRAIHDSKYVMEQLQKYAQAEKDLNRRNLVLRSFGVGDEVIAGMSRNAFTPQVFSKAPSYGENEIRSLDRANIAWSNLGTKIEMAFGHFNAAHGGELVNNISKITTQVLKLVSAFTTLAEKLKLFQGIGKVFEGWSLLLGSVNKGVASAGKWSESPTKGRDLKEGMADFFSVFAEIFKEHQEELGKNLNSLNSKVDENGGLTATIAPRVSLPLVTTPQSTTVNTTVHNHGVKDAHEATQHMKKELNNAGRQIPAQRQGS